MSKPKQQRIAIIGGGVSGLAAAWHLHTQSKSTIDVHIFEADGRLGGHAHTLTLNTTTFTAKDYINGSNTTKSSSESSEGEEKKEDELKESQQQSPPSKTNNEEVDIDVGFMVYNTSNYPNMTNWFHQLNVHGEDTDMSLSVSLDDGTKEWSSHSLQGLFANPMNLMRKEFYTFLKDLMYFNSNAGELLMRPVGKLYVYIHWYEMKCTKRVVTISYSYFLDPFIIGFHTSSDIISCIIFAFHSLHNLSCKTLKHTTNLR